MKYSSSWLVVVISYNIGSDTGMKSAMNVNFYKYVFRYSNYVSLTISLNQGYCGSTLVVTLFSYFIQSKK